MARQLTTFWKVLKGEMGAMTALVVIVLIICGGVVLEGELGSPGTEVVIVSYIALLSLYVIGIWLYVRKTNRKHNQNHPE